eukprot:gene13326-17859_t
MLLFLKTNRAYWDDFTVNKAYLVVYNNVAGENAALERLQAEEIID